MIVFLLYIYKFICTAYVTACLSEYGIHMYICSYVQRITQCGLKWIIGLYMEVCLWSALYIGIIQTENNKIK